MNSSNLAFHLKDLPPALAADIKTAMHMSDREDVKGRIMVLLLNGKSLDISVRHARAEEARQHKPSGFVSLDERKEDDDYSIHELIAATDPADLLDQIRESRNVEFDWHVERAIDSLGNGAADFGRAMNLTARRGQQIVKSQIDRVREEQMFKRGQKGQGGLFGFNGEVEGGAGHV